MVGNEANRYLKEKVPILHPLDQQTDIYLSIGISIKFSSNISVYIYIRIRNRDCISISNLHTLRR